jgi:hypothetical protein
MALHRTMTYYGREDNVVNDLPETWYHYLVIASPGPKAGSGVASIITLSQAKAQALEHGPSHTIFAKEGGPEAALVQAEQFLTAHHPGLKKIISERD